MTAQVIEDKGVLAREASFSPQPEATEQLAQQGSGL
jgi:hypothetical protein